MITLTATVDIVPNDLNSSIHSVSLMSDYTKNNISSDINLVVNNENKYFENNPFILGSSKLGDGSVVMNKVPYFISQNLCNENGVFGEPFALNILGENIKYIIFFFDVNNNEHPLTVQIDTNQYEITNPISVISFDTPRNSGSVLFYNWNRGNRPFVIQGIYVSLEMNVNKTNIMSINSKLVTKKDIELPSYGIISSTGNIEFSDINKEIENYLKYDLIKDNLSCIIKLNNTLIKSSQIVSKKLTDEWGYDNNNRIASISLKDNLEEWQNIYVEGFEYDPQNPQPQNMKYYYDYLYGKTPSKYNMQSFEELSQDTQDRLTNTIIQYPMLESASLWKQWTKLCEICALYIYKDSNDKTICHYRYGA